MKMQPLTLTAALSDKNTQAQFKKGDKLTSNRQPTLIVQIGLVFAWWMRN